MDNVCILLNVEWRSDKLNMCKVMTLNNALD